MALRILFGILSSVGILLAAGIGWQLRRRAKSRKPETRAAIVASDSPLAALQHGDWQVRLRAVQSLAAAHEPEVLAALITRLADPDQDVRVAVVEAIAGYETQALPS
ncbi:MAG: HEAT repeat domain-containing protein, partial [Anaerolineae bacterium]|nr:HEAT repeat domain-containing protein [Anaerolineae bacterium]